MPTIASFENIDVKMQKEGGAQHKKPHIHAYYGEQSASFDIASGDLIVGELPVRETRLVQGWIELHRDELNIEWKTLEAGGKWFTIAGLRRGVRMSEYFEHVKEAEPRGDYKIAVRFTGGSSGLFDCASYANDPFWACLKDVDFFRQVSLDHGVLTWPNGVDIAPEEVWQGAKRESVV